MRVEEKTKTVLRFDAAAYKKRLEDAREEHGGITKFAKIMDLDYQRVQGWIADGSLPRLQEWANVEKSGKGMAWYLFGIEDDMPTDQNLDRKAAMAAIEKLEKDLGTLKMIVRVAATDARLKEAGIGKPKHKTPQPQNIIPSEKKARSRRAAK